MKGFAHKSLDKLAAIEEYVLLSTGIALVVVVALGVVFRYIIRAQLTWAYELSILLFIWVSFLGASVGTRQHAHITFDFLIRLFPPGWNKWLMVLGNVIVLLISIAGIALGYVIFLRTMGQSFQTLPLSRGWMYLALPVGFLFIAIHITENILKLLLNPTIDSPDLTVNGREK
jgi:TRAP-type C4-dicarboxylate transport system permease small subunit